MTTTTTFFATRTLARNAAVELDGKVKDHGSDAAAGKRWAVVVELSAVEVQPEDMKGIPTPAQPLLEMPEAHRNILVLGSVGAGKTSTMSDTIMKNRYGKSVQVKHKRRTNEAKAAWLKDYNAM